VQIGQKLAWRFNPNKENNIFIKYYKYILENIGDSNPYISITQVKGFRSKTKYNNKDNGLVYTKQDMVIFEVLVSMKKFPYNRGIPIYHKNKDIIDDDIESNISYDKEVEAYLLENDNDYTEVLKNIIANSL
jgi:hypothetical protein